MSSIWINALLTSSVILSLWNLHTHLLSNASPGKTILNTSVCYSFWIIGIKTVQHIFSLFKIIMPLKGTQTLSALRKKHLINLGNVRLGILPPLNFDSTRASLLEAIIANIMVNQDCPNIGCMGPCNPDRHLWQEGEYTPANETVSQNIITAISQLLADNQANPQRHQGIPHESIEDRLSVLAEACTALKVDPRLLVDQLQGHEGGQVQQEDAP
jgi:hypothetical protein